MRIAVIGAGSWGLTLANKLVHQGKEVLVWVYEEEEFRELVREHSAEDYLPGIQLHDSILYTRDLVDLCDLNTAILAVPSHGMRSVARDMNRVEAYPQLIINVAKGIENESFLRMSQVILEELEPLDADHIVTLTGPSHAEEVSRDIPTAVVAASESLRTAEQVQQLINDQYFRVYTSNDIVGAELGGSVKNVIAIAAGILDGLNTGDNAKAALMTRGNAEITRLGLAMGAQEATFSGLSGIGDLIVTCLSRHSRNRYVGEQLGKGVKLDEILDLMKMVAEGIKTTESVHQLARQMKVEMPITDQVYEVLFHDKVPEDAVHDLMTRTPAHERHSI